MKLLQQQRENAMTTNRISIADNNIELSFYEGDLRYVNTEDGQGVYPMCFVYFHFNGKTYSYPKAFLASMEYIEEIEDCMLVDSHAKCKEFIAKVVAHGSINLDKWVIDQQDERTTEQRCADEWALEQEERRMYGAATY